ncbi:mannitol dehydrogenase family protein [Herbiconiux sp. UC225_62]|uniref:mannitol dehydrogenase family protein n=1 Tax=Herbiconiux sp. UC225_62 TaxID=3350168 RepID=UPI0036D3DE9A
MTVSTPATVSPGRLPVAPLRFDRAAVTPGILHFGFGAFHRAHQAAYLNALMNEGLALDWGIVGVNVLPQDQRMHEVMLAQDCRYTQVLKHADGQLEAHAIGSVVEHLHAPDDPASVIERLADPRIRIVSLTITEGGYEIDPATGLFEPTSEGVLADLRGLPLGEAPLSVFGFLVAGLRERRARGIRPFTVLSCDNVQSNGQVARTSLVAFARAVDPALAEWIADEVVFPNTMVDRITPITTDDDRMLVREVFGVDDAWPVVAEPFAQWVIEDRFALGRPPFERVGAQFAAEVAPYETMKLRLLNASHQALAHPSSLLGHMLVDEAMADPDVVALLRAYFAEALPTLPPVPGVDLAAYCETLLERYSNPGVRDTVERLAMDAENRLATFLLPVVRDLLAAGRPINASATVLAAHLERSRAAAPAAATAELEQVVRSTAFFGELTVDPAFTGPVVATWALVRAEGVRETLRRMTV